MLEDELLWPLGCFTSDSDTPINSWIFSNIDPWSAILTPKVCSRAWTFAPLILSYPLIKSRQGNIGMLTSNRYCHKKYGTPEYKSRRHYILSTGESSSLQPTRIYLYLTNSNGFRLAILASYLLLPCCNPAAMRVTRYGKSGHSGHLYPHRWRKDGYVTTTCRGWT
jgi:hypothetical protein